MTDTPTPEAPTPEAVKIRRYSRLFVWTMIATWMLSLAPMIYRIGIMPVALLAVVFAVIAFWYTFDVPGLSTMRITLGVGAAGASALAVLGMAWMAIAPEVIALDTCSRTSLTPQGDVVCQQEFRDAVMDRFGVELP